MRRRSAVSACVLTGTRDSCAQTIRVWNVQTQQCLAVLTGAEAGSLIFPVSLPTHRHRRLHSPVVQGTLTGANFVAQGTLAT